MSNEAKDKPTEIIVNTRPTKWAEPTITFEQAVHLAYPNDPPNPDRVYTVTWKKGHREGTLAAGEHVDVEPGMIFNVHRTVRS